MANVDAASRETLTRKEASEYVSTHYFPLSVGMLNKLAWDGSGPRYVGYGHGNGKRPRTLYEKADLDDWAHRRMQAAPAASKSRAAFQHRGALARVLRT